MKIGFDVDGVLADFSSHYQQVLVKTSGRDLFLPGDAEDAPCWDWDKFRGYTKEERGTAWEYIKADRAWWMNHEPVQNNVSTMVVMLKELERKHDVYYITSRVGARAKRQTEIWLFDRLGYPLRCPGVYPTVCIANHRTKGHFAKGLGLDCYIDDNYDNVLDVKEHSPSTRVYLRNRRYNYQTMVTAEPNGELILIPYPPLPDGIIRVNTVGDMLDHEILRNNL